MNAIIIIVLGVLAFVAHKMFSRKTVEPKVEEEKNEKGAASVPEPIEDNEIIKELPQEEQNN